MLLLDHSAFINFKYFTFQSKWYFCPLFILTSETHQDSSCFFLRISNLTSGSLKNRGGFPSIVIVTGYEIKATRCLLSAADAKGVTMQVIQLVLVFSLYHFKVTEAKCNLKCEQTSVRISDTRLKNRALMGHSFKNFTVNKPFDCYEKCSHERCRCQAFQIKGEGSCELLDEDRFSAPDEFQEEEGYEYFDLNREYKKPVRNIINASIILNVTRRIVMK